MTNKSCSKHPDKVVGFDGSIEDLARNVGNMRYDSVERFITALADDIERQADDDAKKGRTKLADVLYATAGRLYQARDEMSNSWKICKPYMD